MADLAELAGAPVHVTIAGERFLVAPATLRELGALQGWFKRSIPSPAMRAAEAIDRAERLGSPLSTRARELLMDAAVRAEQAWPPRVGSLPWLCAIDDADELAGFVLEALRPSAPGLDAARARELAEAAAPAEVNALVLARLYGKTPTPSPKAGAPTPGPAPEADPTSPSGPSATSGAGCSTA